MFGPHIPTPELRAYGLAITIVYGLSSVSVAIHIYARWFAHTRVSFGKVRAVVMIFAVVSGFCVFGTANIIGEPSLSWILLVPGGAFLGWEASLADKAIIRRFVRSRLALKAKLAPSILGVKRQFSSNVAQPDRRRLYSDRIIRNLPGDFNKFSLGSILAGAVLEELIYRGTLVRACYLLPTATLVAAGLAVTCLLFALSHIHFGWPQVFAKLPLSLAATVTVLVSQTVLPAIIAHVFFNLHFWEAQKLEAVHAGE